MTAVELDPRWEWVEVTTISDPAPRYIRGACNHLEVAPVTSMVDGEVLAGLCLTCDAQLPAGMVSA